MHHIIASTTSCQYHKFFGVTIQTMSFGQKFKQLREERGLTQTDVAKAIGVDKSYASSWENNRSKPSLDNAIALSKFFQVSLDYLMFDNVPREGVEAINDIELYEYFRKAERLPEEMKQAVKLVVDAIMIKQKLKEMPELETSPKEKTQTPALRKVAGKR